MTTQQRSILHLVRLGKRTHDFVMLQYGWSAAADIHALYMADVIGISNDGILYPKAY